MCSNNSSKIEEQQDKLNEYLDKQKNYQYIKEKIYYNIKKAN